MAGTIEPTVAERRGRSRIRSGLALAILPVFTGCSGESGARQAEATAQSCMTCHNGSQLDDYAGPGLENPHPFGGMGVLLCTTCHGGNPEGEDVLASHVPPPPEIGDREQQDHDAHAYFNRLTLAGVDKFPNYLVDGVTYSPIDWLQFVNPGDVRVVTRGRGCGACHEPHAEAVAGSLLATQAGFLSAATYTSGVESEIPAHQGLYEDTAADVAFRAVQDSDSVVSNEVGAIARLVEFPVFSVFGATGPDAIFDNPLYDAAELADDRNADGSTITGSPLANLFYEQVAFTCADCHLGSAGANNRYGDFRSSGCTACHMRYSLDGRSTSGDPNVPRDEPLDPDDIDDPERPHIARHLVRSVAKTLPDGEVVQGIDDHTCAGCHQGSNRTVLQFWGIRLDQNADLANGLQYPANPESFENTADDTRLYDPVVGNHTFNGRNANQYILYEDYDGDGRDDTPPDVHYAAGMGCIDCHGSNDLHGPGLAEGSGTALLSRMEQQVAIQCESCHGDADTYAETETGTAFDGTTAELAVDRKGNVLNHVVKHPSGRYWLTSKLTGARHYVPQARDAVVKSNKVHPITNEPLYSELASYAMGRDDGIASNGIGPTQTGIPAHGFSHMDNMSCAACHASWSNNCIGCHLRGEYDTGNNFSNITGERIVFEQANADFTYQTPVPFQLGVNAHGKIAPISPNTEAFFGWIDRHGELSQVRPFTDRNGGGNNTLDSAYPSLSHNVIMPHSIRGKVDAANEGPRYCVACHLTDQSLASFGTEYDLFRTAMATNDFGALDFPLLATHIGRNPGNQLDSPLWVHMVAGLGSGLFLFDESGCAVNPLDTNVNRVGCDGEAPADNFDPLRVRLNLDRIVEPSGASNGSNSHPFVSPTEGPLLRDGAANPDLAGPLGATLIQRLSDPTLGIVLDSWIDADATARGDAGDYLDD